MDIDKIHTSDQHYTNQKKQFSKSGFIDYEDAVLFEKKKKLELNYEMNFIKKYKITVDEFGHVSSVEAVTNEDIIKLGIPAQDTTYEVAVATTETEDGVDGLLSADDKAKYDKYEATIASLQQQIADLKALVESYHPVVEQEPEPEPETE